MHIRFLCVCALSLILEIASAQTIEGIIRDDISGEVLVGALIQLDKSEVGSVSDEEGFFNLKSVSPGLHTVNINYLGYQSYRLIEIWVKSGKTTFLEIQMTRSIDQLDELVVSTDREMKSVSSVQITEEGINRFAATYYDPARLVNAVSDITVTNDQSNQISVRGLNPDYNIWRLEGVEIVNPNHLSNTGTFNDQPAASSGGVNILSAQMLDRSSFLYSDMNNTYSNTVGGLFDMHLRNGYAGDHQFTAQASLIGFDFCAEGPVSKNSKVSYLANYRYSFTGLLGAMNVDFGGETIGFQDLALNINIPMKKGASMKFFALGGLSSNDFKAFDLESSEIAKHRSDILYKGKMGLFGLNYQKPLGKRLKLSFSSVYSTSQDNRDQTRYDYNQEFISKTSVTASQGINASRVTTILNLGRFTANTGTNINLYVIRDETKGTYSRTSIKHEIPKILISPYSDWSIRLSEKLTFNTGFTVYHLRNRYDNKNDMDYRGQLIYSLYKTQISATAGRYSQRLNPKITFIDHNYSIKYDYDQLGMINSYRYITKVAHKLSQVTLAAEGFLYQFPEINKKRITEFEFDAEGNTYYILTSYKSARTKGISISLSQANTKFYYNIGATWFDSTFGDGFDNKFNTKQSYNFITGKKWNRSKGNKKKELSINLKGIYQGGLFQLSDNADFKNRLNDYARLDIRIQSVRFKDNSTRSWSIDIQNITNRQNEAFQYYDSFTGQVEMNYQLGLIPILTYRIEF